MRKVSPGSSPMSLIFSEILSPKHTVFIKRTCWASNIKPMDPRNPSSSSSSISSDITFLFFCSNPILLVGFYRSLTPSSLGPFDSRVLCMSTITTSSVVTNQTQPSEQWNVQKKLLLFSRKRMYTSDRVCNGCILSCPESIPSVTEKFAITHRLRPSYPLCHVICHSSLICHTKLNC